MALTLTQVEQLYVGYFGRAGDTAGVQYWIANGGVGSFGFAQVAASFSVQPEAVAKYPFLAAPNIANVGSFIDQVYVNLFGHVADAAGKAFWTTQLNASLGNPQAVGQFIVNVISGAQGTDLTAINAKVAVASDFTTQVTNNNVSWSPSAAAQSTTELASVIDATTQAAAIAQTTTYVATAPGPQVNFTLGIDTLASSATNANYNAPLIFNAPGGALVQSLQTGDSVTNTGTGGTLTASFNAAGVVSGFNMSGVPTAILTNTTTGAANAAGFAGNITGLTTVTSSGSSGAIALGATGNGLRTALTTINLSNLNGAQGTNSVNNILIAASALAGASDALAINTTGAAGTTAVQGATAGAVILNVNNDSGTAGTAATPQNNYETISVTANTSGTTSVLQLSNGGANVQSTTTVNVAGAGAVQLFAANAGDFQKVTTINATTDTGGVVVSGAAGINSQGKAAGAAGFLAGNTGLTSFKGGSGNDFVDLSSMTAGQLGAITATNLDGGAGTDTLIMSTGAAHGTTVFNATNFETVGIASDAGGTVNVANLGSGVTTIQLFGAANTGADTFNNATNGLTLALDGLAGAQAYTINGPSGTADVLNITAIGATAMGALTTTAYETVNLTLSGAAAETIASIAATPTPGGAEVFNLVDNITGGGAVGVTTTVNLGTAGALNLSGTGTGTVTIGGAVTAGAVNASGLSSNLVMSANSTSQIVLTGSAGADTLIGSGGADTINGGAGNDTIHNHLATGANFTGGATISTGSGNDLVSLRGDVAGTATNYTTTPTVANDFTVGTGASTDKIILDATNSATSYGGVSAFTGQAGAIAAGAAVVQGITQNSTVAASAGVTLYKLVTGVAFHTDIQTTFNDAIGTATVTGAANAVNSAVVVTMYDSTNSKMDLLEVGTGAANASLNTGDVVHLIGSVNMSASDYANVGNNHISFA